jgi:Concanavalin A-like lectin/glucanases superfamily
MIAPAPSSATASTPVPPAAAHWAFDEATGSTLIDQSGNDRDGTFTGQVTRIDDGVYERALRLHSSSTSVTAPGAGLDPTYLTVSLWVRGDETPSTGAVLLEKGARDCEGASYGVYAKGDGIEVRLMDRGGVPQWYPLDLDLGLWDGEWHHVSFTTAQSDIMRLYVDGSVWGFWTGGLIPNDEDLTSRDFSFGGSAGGQDCDVPAFIGDLDDIRIYELNLDQNQIGALEPPIPTTTTLTVPSDVRAYSVACWTANVAPAPGGGGLLRVSELLADGREVDIGLATNQPCAGQTPPPGTYLVSLRFTTKGTHQVRARFIPGDPWQASTSEWAYPDVAGVPTTTSIKVDPVAAWEPIEVWTGVAGSDTYMTGSIALYDITSGTPTLIETKAIPFTGATSGSVTFQLPGRPAGAYRFEARYLGDSDVFEPSSAAADLTVTGSSDPDTTPPIATAPSHRFVTGTAISSGRTTVRLGWTGSDATSGIARYELVQQTDGGTWTTVSTSLTSTSLDRALAHGHTYRFRVRAIDRAGNPSSWVSGPTFRIAHYGETSTRLRYSGTWAITRSTAFWGGQAKASSSAGARATISVTGRSVEWVARKAPTRGKAQVYVNGVLKATVDLYASSYQNQRVVWAANWSTSATRTVSIRVLGTSGRPRVEVDAIVVGA